MKRILLVWCLVGGTGACGSLLAAEETATAEATAATEPSQNGEAKKEAEAKTKEAKPEKQEADSKKRKTFTVAAVPLRLEEKVTGTFVADQMSEVMLKPEEWSDFEIVKTVPHGTRVEKGETLLKFDDKKLLQAIAELEIDLHLGELRLERAQRQLPLTEESIARNLADAQESMERVEEDSQRYKDHERQMQIDSANMSLKSSKFYLDYYKDELEQLEKMYEADDLTEETEEIVLRRQRFYVEASEFDYKNSQYYHDRTLNITIPRRDHDVEESLKRTRQNLTQAEVANEVDLSIARYELEKLRQDRKKSLERHVNLLSDKGLLEVKSPAAGVVYYGECKDGKWPKIADMTSKLAPGKKADKDQVLMTVVDDEKMTLVAKLDQKYLIATKSDSSVQVLPQVEGAEKIRGSVASVSSVPVEDGKFELRIRFTDALPEWLVPGIGGEATIVAYEKKDALLVPKSAVHEEIGTPDKYVWVVRDDKVEKTSVETGKQKGDHTEIVSGLKAGDVISLEDEAKDKD